MHNPIVVIGLAGLAAWLFGAAWYTTLGKHWQRALGQNPDDCKGKKMPITPLVVCLLAEWLMAATMYQVLTNLGVSGWQDGAIAGATLGVGFLLTTTVVNNAFQQKSKMLTVIDGAHWVLVLVIEGAIVAAMTA
jgi:hypothetical protein